VVEGDGTRWDGRHAAAGPDLAPEPPAALHGNAELVPTAGTALDVACGRGAVAVWLAERGLRVDAVDVSPVGLAAGAALARRRGVGDRVRWWRHDLDAGLPDVCAGPYAVVVCQRYRDPVLYPALAARLALGGLLVVTVLSTVGGPSIARSRWRAGPGELPTAFPGLEVLAAAEGEGEAHLVARRPR
jgi:SAM-dependent methyltransferase